MASGLAGENGAVAAGPVEAGSRAGRGVVGGHGAEIAQAGNLKIDPATVSSVQVGRYCMQSVCGPISPIRSY